MSGRTRYEAAREVPLTRAEITYLQRLVERDIVAVRGADNAWKPALALIDHVAAKLARAQLRGRR
jgi:hypothetical protein